MNIESVYNSIRARHLQQPTLRSTRCRGTASCFFDLLPRELVEIIFSSLDRPSALTARLVCRQWERTVSRAQLVLCLDPANKHSNAVLKLLALFPHTKMFVLHNGVSSWSADEWQELYNRKEGAPIFDWTGVSSDQMRSIIEVLERAGTWRYTVDACSAWIPQMDATKKATRNRLYWKKAAALMSLKQYKESRSIWALFLQLDPDDHSAWCNYGMVLEQLHEDKEAIFYYNRAIELATALDQCPDLYYRNRAIVRAKCNLPELALQDLDHLESPNIYDIHRRARLLLDLDRHQEAVTLLEEAVITHSQDEQLLEKLALAHLDGMNFAGAQEAIEMARKISPDDPYLVDLHARLLFETNRYSEALELYRDNVLPHLPDATTFCSLGLCYDKLGMLEEARQSFLKILEQPMESENIRELRGHALLSQNRATEALECFNRALSSRPTMFWGRAKAFQALGRIEEAWIDICKAVAIRPLQEYVQMKDELERMRG